MKNWYIVQTFSGFEQKVADVIKENIKKKDLNEQIDDVMVPMLSLIHISEPTRPL